MKPIPNFAASKNMQGTVNWIIERELTFATVCKPFIDIVNMIVGNSCKLIHFQKKRAIRLFITSLTL